MYLNWEQNKSKYKIIDIETDDLKATVIHCAVVISCHDGVVHRLVGRDAVLKFIQEADRDTIWVGHNALSFDIPTINRLLGTSIPVSRILDTLVLSYLYHPRLPGGHSLESYGERLGIKKEGVGIEDFTRYTPALLERCVSDARINFKLLEILTRKMRHVGFSEKSCYLEHRIRHVIDKQQRNGFHFDTGAAKSLYASLRTRQQSLEESIREIFPAELVRAGDYQYRVTRDGRPYSSYVRHLEEYDKVEHNNDGTYSVYEHQDFNIASPLQRLRRLTDLGWEPKKFTKKGNPQVDEDSLKDFAKTLQGETGEKITAIADYLVVFGRANMIDTWLNHVSGDSRIHGKVFSCGAASRRMTHTGPNCVPLYSQALTRNGWRYYNELVVGEDILAYDLNTKTKKWTPLLDVSTFDQAEIYSFGQKHPDKRFFCTRNHSWVNTARDSSGHKNDLKEKLVEAHKLRHNARIRINAPFDNDVKESDFELIQEKYERDWTSEICKLSDPELKAMMQGFLLADGCRPRGRETWTFAQAEGSLLDAFLTCLYLISETRISACQKRKLKGLNQRMGYNVVQTKSVFMRTKDMSLRYEGIEPVWCPTTEFGTWVMKQDDFITITGNTANIPSTEAEYGQECRRLWTVPDHSVWTLLGYDAKSIQMRCFANVLPDPSTGRRYYDTEFCPDPHQENADIIGIARKPVKNVFFANLFGAYPPKLASTAGMVGTRQEIETYGTWIQEQMYLVCPGLKEATEAAQAEFDRNGGFLLCPDGGYVRCPNRSAALNYKIQPAEAIVMKTASVMIDQKGREKGIEHRKVADVHDEGQHQVIHRDAEELGKITEDAIRDAGEELNFRVPLAGSFKIGPTWAETH
jgi:hypothetical protein